MSAYVRLTDIMQRATLHVVGVVTKLYFAIFAAFKEPMTLNLTQRSLKSYILAAIESPCTTLYRPFGLGSNFRSIFNSFGDIADFICTEQLCK